jgi:hypothetical protein
MKWVALSCVALLQSISSLASAEILVLNCETRTQTRPPEINQLTLRVDLERSTVLGRPAKITDASITFTIDGAVGVHFVNTIDRVTGRITVDGTDNGAPIGTIASGRCERVTGRAF